MKQNTAIALTAALTLMLTTGCNGNGGNATGDGRQPASLQGTTTENPSGTVTESKEGSTGAVAEEANTGITDPTLSKSKVTEKTKNSRDNRSQNSGGRPSSENGTGTSGNM